MQHHPDRNPGDKAAEEKFGKPQRHMKYSATPINVHQYDRFGHAGVSGNGRGGFGVGHGMNMEDIFSQFGDIFSEDILAVFLAGWRRLLGSHDVYSWLTAIKIKLNTKKLQRCNQNSKVKIRGMQYRHGNGAKDKAPFKPAAPVVAWTGEKSIEHFLGQMQTVSTCPACNGEGTTITNKCTM
jgi:molecular chaperone DnaJ